MIDARNHVPSPWSRLSTMLDRATRWKRRTSNGLVVWMSADEPSESEPDPSKDAPVDWGARVREWATQLGDWVDALLPTPSPAPVLVPVPVRTRRRR